MVSLPLISCCCNCYCNRWIKMVTFTSITSAFFTAKKKLYTPTWSNSRKVDSSPLLTKNIFLINIRTIQTFHTTKIWKVVLSLYTHHFHRYLRYLLSIQWRHSYGEQLNWKMWQTYHWSLNPQKTWLRVLTACWSREQSLHQEIWALVFKNRYQLKSPI